MPIITVNGEKREVDTGISVAELLQELGIRGRRVAVERNREIVSRTNWAEIEVRGDDEFEIIELVGGG